MGHKPGLEKMVSFEILKSVFRGKKVFLTGHTGFKGAWMLQLLSLLGAEVKGFALSPLFDFDLYHLIDGDQLCKSSVIDDIRNADRLRHELIHFEPDFVFHMAAQPLVLQGYEQPLYTFEVNTQGTANLLEAVRFLSKRCVVVCITTDKVYENHDTGAAFVESDKLGGYDPYSASKAAAEIVVSSYRNSFFNDQHFDRHQKSLASVRAGNVIGGGDFSPNRIIPDIVRALKEDKEITLRNPNATRPWQHVIEPLVAYLWLAAKMHEQPVALNSAFNIGPEKDDVLSVEALTQIAIQCAGRGVVRVEDNVIKLHEAATLMLDNQKIKTAIGWQPIYKAAQAIEQTISWYFDLRTATEKCAGQIHQYFERLSEVSPG